MRPDPKFTWDELLAVWQGLSGHAYLQGHYDSALKKIETYLGPDPDPEEPYEHPPTTPTNVEEIPRCPHERCGTILLAIPSGGCGEVDFVCPIKTEWPHGIDQSRLAPDDRWIWFPPGGEESDG